MTVVRNKFGLAVRGIETLNQLGFNSAESPKLDEMP